MYGWQLFCNDCIEMNLQFFRACDCAAVDLCTSVLQVTVTVHIGLLHNRLYSWFIQLHFTDGDAPEEAQQLLRWTTVARLIILF